MAGTPWMDATLRPRQATNLPASEGRTHMFYTGTPLFPFGFGLSYTDFELGWAGATAGGATAGGATGRVVTVAAARVATELPNVTFSVTVTNTGSRRGKETVMAYWSPPDSVDADLKRQLFAFEGVVLDAGASQTLTFSLPADAGSIATVTEGGDRVFHPGLSVVLCHYSTGGRGTLGVGVGC